MAEESKIEKVEILEALRSIEEFISLELDQRRSSYLPTSDDDDIDYIGSAAKALNRTRYVIGRIGDNSNVR